MMNEDNHFVVEGAPGIGVKIIDTKQVPRQDKPGKTINRKKKSANFSLIE